MAKETKSEKEQQKMPVLEGKTLKIDAETARKIQELQMLEQNLQTYSLQKQTFQLELNETLNAINELHDAKEDVYKIVGSIMLRAKKADLEKDLKQKKEMLDLRTKSIEKQEEMLREKLLKTRDDLMQGLK